MSMGILGIPNCPIDGRAMGELGIKCKFKSKKSLLFHNCFNKIILNENFNLGNNYIND